MNADRLAGDAQQWCDTHRHTTQVAERVYDQHQRPTVLRASGPDEAALREQERWVNAASRPEDAAALSVANLWWLHYDVVYRPGNTACRVGVVNHWAARRHG